MGFDCQYCGQKQRCNSNYKINAEENVVSNGQGVVEPFPTFTREVATASFLVDSHIFVARHVFTFGK